MVHSFLRPVFWSGVAVTLTLGCREFYSPGKCQPPPRKAICLPETAIDEYNLEIADREGDTPFPESSGVGSRNANLSACWHCVYRTGWAEGKLADMSYMTDLAGAGHFLMLRF